MARLRLQLVLLVILLVATACGSGGAASQPTAAPLGGADTQATAAPAVSEATAVVEATVADQPTAVAAETAAVEQPTAASGGAADELQVDKSKLSSELHVYNWADYIEPEIITDFEGEYGVKVTVEVYSNNEDMIAKVRPGNSGYDIVVPSDYAVDLMARDNLLTPLDKSLLPNLKNINTGLLDLYYDKGNKFSVPYNTGMTGIGYDKTKFPTPPDSWGVLFDPAQAEKFQGQFTMLDDEREVPGAALRYTGKSLNDTDPADLKKVEDILKTQKPFVSAYDTDNAGRKLASGEVIMAHIYNNTALQARLGLEGNEGYAGNPNIGFFIPKEGATIWQDNLAILADAPNKYTAHVFLNYLMRPEVAAKNEEYILGVTPNVEAEKLLPADLQALFKEGFAPDAETLKRLEWIEFNDKTTAISDLWTAVKGE
jgi:spermidine/putrescine transport system substrate-binding protein